MNTTSAERAVGRPTERPESRARGPESGEFALSLREWQVTAEVRRGLTNREIGLVLGVSEHSVKKTLKVLFRKLEVDSRAQLVDRAHTLGLLGRIVDPAVFRPGRRAAG